MSHHFVKFSNVSYTYPNGYKALNNVSFNITHGEKVAFLGRNGAGKSTALLHTNGLLMAQSGEVNIGGVIVTKKTLPLVREHVGMVFQDPDDQLFMPTVEDDVAFGPRNMRLPESDVERRVVEALTAVGALELRKRAPYQLSGGQRRNVALATVLSMEPCILVLDEPTSNLDLPSRRQFIDIVKGFSHTCIIASHDLAMVKELCQRAIVIEDGKVAADAPLDDVLSDRSIMEMLGLDKEKELVAY